MIPADVNNIRCWFCRVLGHSVYMWSCFSLRQHRYCPYQAYLARQGAAPPSPRSGSREISASRSGYWPRKGGAQRAHGRRSQVEWGDQHPKALSRKETQTGVEGKSSAVLAAPHDEGMPAPQQVYSNPSQGEELESSSDSANKALSEKSRDSKEYRVAIVVPLL